MRLRYLTSSIWFPSPRPQREKLLHGSRGWHRSGVFPAKLQLLFAGAIPRPARSTAAIRLALSGSIGGTAASVTPAR